MTEREIDTRWEREQAAQPALPTPFRDSPAADAALIAAGADFAGGDGHLTLTGIRTEDGEVVWRTIVHDVEYRTPFT